MANAWLVEEINRDNRSKIFIFSIPNVGTSSNSGEVIFDLKNIKSGHIQAIKIKCLSTDFDFDLFSKSGQTYPSIYGVLRNEDNNLESSGTDLAASFINFESPQVAKLYGKLTNNDGGNATGVIYVSLEIYY